VSTPKGHVPLQTGVDVIRDLSRAVMNQERRPEIKKASDLLGPGFGSYAKQLLDWNSPSARFNGFWATSDALNGPTETGKFMGLSIATADGHVAQVAIEHAHDAADPNRVYARRVHLHASQAIAYTPWEQVHPAPTGVPGGAVVFLETTATLPSGWEESAATAPAGLRAIRKV
jgi:hypothetical protein